ncbi:MAG: hypothetical protein R3B54_05350 [Bdellovibrionota bacterium]
MNNSFQDQMPRYTRLHTILAALSLLLAVCVLALNWKAILAEVRDWSLVRSTATMVLNYALPWYYNLNQGPVVTQLYAPLSFLSFFPLVLFQKPYDIFLAGTLIAACLCFLPLGYLLYLSFRERKADAIVCFAICLVGSIALRPLRYSFFSIHADAPATLFMLLAIGFATFKNKPGLLLFSSLCAVCAPLAKQTFVWLPLGVLWWVQYSSGWKTTVRYARALVFSSALLGVLFIAIYGFEPLLANLVLIPGKHPFRQVEWRPTMAFILLACVLVSFLAILSRGFAKRTQTLNQIAMLCLFCSIASLPLNIYSTCKVYGDVNNLSSTYVLSLVGILLLLPERLATWRALENKQLILRLGAFVLLSPGFLLWTKPSGWEDDTRTRFSAIESASQYIRRHPGEYYFPNSPLIHLLSESKLYHFEPGLKERETYSIYGQIPDNQLYNFIPERTRCVCYYKDFSKRDEPIGIEYDTLAERYLRQSNLKWDVSTENWGWFCQKSAADSVPCTINMQQYRKAHSK